LSNFQIDYSPASFDNYGMLYPGL